MVKETPGNPHGMAWWFRYSTDGPPRRHSTSVLDIKKCYGCKGDVLTPKTAEFIKSLLKKNDIARLCRNCARKLGLTW